MKTKQKAGVRKGKVTKGEFPDEIQAMSMRLRAHFKASLALEYSPGLEIITWTWNLIKNFVKETSNNHSSNDIQALRYLKQDNAMRSRFLDYVSSVLPFSSNTEVILLL